MRTGSIIRSALKKVIYPWQLWKVIRLESGNKRSERTYDDPQLKLYSEILPGDFLHYGYFDDLTIQPQDISLNSVYRAQLRYAELILEKIADRESPVLDVGCGMGGLVKLMLDRGLHPVALLPEKNQIDYIRTKYPLAPLIQSKFEDIPLQDHLNRYGTIITSESLQYLYLDASLPLMEKLLKPGGRWIACDYFRVGRQREKSGHFWDDFERRILTSGWRFVQQHDITPNVLPTIAYVHMWGDGFARPVLNFAFEKLKTKHPGAHYVLANAIDGLNESLERNLDTVNPETFAANKKYMLLVMERN